VIAPAAAPLSRVVTLADWEDDDLVALMRDVTGLDSATVRPHRKTWEFAMGVRALRAGGALTAHAEGLSVGAGHEAILYFLTRHCRRLLATDIYGSGDFARGESSGLMLVDPDLFAPYPYERRRLLAAYMDALDLRLEDGTIDFVVSFGSIEHFGGVEAAATSLSEMGRVLRPGGIAFVTTEMLVDGGPAASLPGLELFTPDSLAALVEADPRLDWLDGSDLSVPDENLPVIDLADEIGRIEAGDQSYPHLRIGVRHDGGYRVFSSVSLALRRKDDG
jgi:SAM-dependent methyltransferase